MNSIIISSFFLVLLCCLSDNSVSSSAVLEVASASSLQPSIIANINNDDAPTKTAYSNTILHQSTSTQDAYVKASPLSVAAVCNDGIVMISLHYNVDIDIDEEKDVEMTSSSSTTANKDKEDNTELASEKAQEIQSNDDNVYTALVEKKSIEQQQKQHQQVANKIFRDLPLSTRGPLRIEPIYESTSSSGRGEPPPMALLTAGWRTDGITLCDAARELVSEEVRLYCLPTLVGMSNDEEKDTSVIEDDDKMIQS